MSDRGRVVAAGLDGDRTETDSASFSLLQGGPFNALLGHLGLLRDDGLPAPLAALVCAVVAWMSPAIVVVVQSFVDDHYAGWDFFTDPTAWSRYLIAVAVMVATERHADGRIRLLVAQFGEAQLVGGEARSAFQQALSRADRLSSSAIAEGVILVVALAWTGFTSSYAVTVAGSSWEGIVVDGHDRLSWAGKVARLVSAPLFAFLLLRWLWYFTIWGALLFRIARLPLQLTPLHPDRSAGLGFLSIYPSVFVGFVFALSCVVASAFIKEMGLVEHDAQTIWLALATWLGVVAVVFVSPLLAFSPLLQATRERALLEYGRLANQHHLAFDRRWIAARRSGEELMGSADVSSASDLNASIETIRSMQTLPVDRPSVLKLLIAAGLPLLAVVLKQVGLVEILRWLVGVLV